MNSNENDAMEQNDVLSEINILICYMHESELRMQSYGAGNISTWICNSWDLEEKSTREKSQLGTWKPRRWRGSPDRRKTVQIFPLLYEIPAQTPY